MQFLIGAFSVIMVSTWSAEQPKKGGGVRHLRVIR